MELEFVTSAFERALGDYTSLPIVNMFADGSPNEGMSLVARPGLDEAPYTAATGYAQAIYKRDGVFGGDLFRIHYNNTGTSTFYRNSSSVGNFTTGTPNQSPASIDGYSNRLFMTAPGGDVWQYNGSTLTMVSTPGSVKAQKVLIGASRLIVIQFESNIFFWTDPLGNTINALDTATAEQSPDLILDAIYQGDTLILFGSETVEFWPATTEADLPFRPLVGRTFRVGIKNVGAVAQIADTFAWVTNRNQVCVGTPENIISFPGLEAKIAGLVAVAPSHLYRFFLDGNEFLCLQIYNETWIYSLRTGTWSTFTSASSYWQVECWDGDFFGGTDGSVQQWGSTTADETYGAFDRTFRAYGNIPSGGLVAHNVTLRGNPGHTASGGAKSVTMRYSLDGGDSWSSYLSESFGSFGQYRLLVRWLALGMFSQPSVLFEFRVTEDMPYRVSKVYINEAYGGV